MIFNIANLALLSSLACAVAIPKNVFDITTLSSRAANDQISAQVLAIAPTSNTCTGATYPTECATNVQAAPFLYQAFLNNSITNLNEIAAILSLMAYETGEFKYNINHYPGTPGQGTRNMQMPDYNLAYAKSFPQLASQVSAITTATTTASLSTSQKNQILALVLPDQFSWGSGPWYYKTYCASSKSAVQAGGQAGFAAYMSCVGASASSDRQAYFARANAALGIQ